MTSRPININGVIWDRDRLARASAKHPEIGRTVATHAKNLESIVDKAKALGKAHQALTELAPDKAKK
jgi:hypothetical protein